MNANKPHTDRCFSAVNGQQGIALVLVLWVLALLTVITAELAFSLRTELLIVRNFKEATQAYFIAQAGMNQTILALVRRSGQPNTENATPTTEFALPRINHENPGQPFGNGTFRVWLDNASGRIDLNRAGPELLRLAVDRLQIDEREKETIVDAILDWRDDDDFRRLHGAESNYYRSLKTPYACGNGPFNSVDAIRLVKGISREIYRELEPVFAAIPLSTGNEDAEAVYAMPVSGGPAGSQININAASAEVLEVLPLMDASRIELIQRFRQTEDFVRISQLRDIIGADVFASVEPYITVALSPFYEIRVQGLVASSPVAHAIEALVQIVPYSRQKYSILRLEEDVF